MSVDPLAAKYPSISPYAFTANNPIKLADPDGKRIIVTRIAGGGEDGKDLILITITAKIVDNTTINAQISALKAKEAKRIEKGKELNKNDAARLASLTAKRDYIENNLPNVVLSQLKVAYTGSGTSVDWKFDTEGSSVTFAENPDFVNPDDHVLYPVDQLYAGEQPDPSNYAKTIPAYSNGSRAELGGFAAYFSLGVDAELVGPDRVYAHELGHNAGFLHPSSMYKLLNHSLSITNDDFKK
ncbi:MAG TPA: hypothetical protein PKA00_23615 [Saprospiraceae bacterium]|nr:hypothetical protein [Saprospiraceae bacterium]